MVSVFDTWKTLKGVAKDLKIRGYSVVVSKSKLVKMIKAAQQEQQPQKEMTPLKQKINLEASTLKNTKFRKIIWTTQLQQLVLMALLPNQSIGLERHIHTDQFFRIESGIARVELSRTKLGKKAVFLAQEGDAFVVPMGTWHNITNSDKKKRLHLYTIYSPPKHPQK